MIKRFQFFIVAMIVCLGLGVTSWAQQDWHQSDDRDHGFYGQDGDHDRDDGYYRDHDRDRDDGYYRDHDGDRDDYNRGYNRRWQNEARHFGYVDGIRDGQNDSREGHSYRPERVSDFKHADRGYSSNFGDKDLYRQEYRQAFLEGYRSSYRRY
jgi:hypothetical protein